jgi:hypothetical protein
LLESLMGVAYRTGAVRVRSSPREPALRKARVCYDHLAGQLGVFVFESLRDSGALRVQPDHHGIRIDLTDSGHGLFRELGIDTAALGTRRRAFCRTCLDWSERRHHLAGALGASLLTLVLDRGWARRDLSSRVVHFSSSGERALRKAFDIGDALR